MGICDRIAFTHTISYFYIYIWGRPKTQNNKWGRE